MWRLTNDVKTCVDWLTAEETWLVTADWQVLADWQLIDSWCLDCRHILLLVQILRVALCVHGSSTGYTFEVCLGILNWLDNHPRGTVLCLLNHTLSCKFPPKSNCTIITQPHAWLQVSQNSTHMPTEFRVYVGYSGDSPAPLSASPTPTTCVHFQIEPSLPLRQWRYASFARDLVSSLQLSSDSRRLAVLARRH